MSSVRVLLLITLLIAFVQPVAFAQAPSPWRDDLVDHMAGTWNLDGQVMGRDAHHKVEAEWVLNHQFLRIHEKTDSRAPSSERSYEAIWFLGYDTTSKRYVLHLMDIFGGRFSETLGYGSRHDNEIQFVFDYPDGSFHTAYRWSPSTDTWQWLMEQKDKDGKWTKFADLKLARVH